MTRFFVGLLVLASTVYRVAPLTKLTAEREGVLVHGVGEKRATTTGALSTTATSELQYYQSLYADEQEKVKQTQNTCVSMMLLVSVGFMMANFYLVNSEDEDIKVISWQVISSTISIFSSVLIFQAIQGCVDTYLLAGASTAVTIIAGFVHMIIWFTVLQLALAASSGAMMGRSEIDEIESLRAQHEAHLNQLKEQTVIKESDPLHRELQRQQKEEIHEYKEQIHLDTKALAILLGHITGFAAINAFGNIQQALPHNPIFSLMAVFIAIAGVLMMTTATNSIRNYIALWGDGHKDEWEELWDEEVAETENDVVALSVSWLLVQVCRETIVGALPDVEGEDTDKNKITMGCCFYLLLFGFGCALVSVLKSAFFKGTKEEHSGGGHEHAHGGEHAHGEEHGHEGEHGNGEGEDRFSNWSRDILSMAMAWSVLFGVNWYLKPRMDVEEDSSLLTTANAMITTTLAISLIFVLDWLADQDWTDDDVDKALRAFISAFGILIGFAWERSFDSAVGGLANDGVLPFSPAITKLLLAIGLGLMVIPAWKWHILKHAREVEEEFEEHHHQLLESASHSPHGHEDVEKAQEAKRASLREVVPPQVALKVTHKAMELMHKTREKAMQKQIDELQAEIEELKKSRVA